MGIWLAVKLFAGGIMKFIAANWKWVLPIILAVVAYFWVTNAIDDARKEGYKSGYNVAQVEFKKKIADEDARNRKFEQRLEKLIGNYGVRIVNEAMQRVSKETILKETLRETVKNNPVYEQCIADAQTIETRNSIRALGPISKEVVSAPIKGLDND